MKRKPLDDLFATLVYEGEDVLLVEDPVVEVPPEVLEEIREEVRTGNSPDAAVVEFYGDNLDELTAKVKAAADRLGEGAVLYLSLPRTLGKEARGKLSDLLGESFTRCGTLNIGTNPYLRNTDVNMRWGYVCVK